MINRRLYLASPTEIQRLLIVPYVLSSHSSRDNRDNRDNKSVLQRVQDNKNNRGDKHGKIIVGTNNSHCLTIGWVSTHNNSNFRQGAEDSNMG